MDELAKIIHDVIENDDDSGGGAYARAAAAVRAHLMSDEAVERACVAAIPEPTHLYVGRDESYRIDMLRAVKLERLVFETKLRDALPALLKDPNA